MRKFTGILYFVFLFLGVFAAYKGDWIVMLFWAITCASQNIAVSIDNIARTMTGKGALKGSG